MISYTTPPARASYPSLVEPNMKGTLASKKYQVSLLFPETTDLTPLINVALERRKQEWPNLGMQFPDVNFLSTYIDAHGVTWRKFTPKTKDRPPIVDINRAPLQPSAIYAGCWIRAIVTPYLNLAPEYRGKVFFALQAVQFLKDGDRFVSAVDVDAGFSTPPAEIDDVCPF